MMEANSTGRPLIRYAVLLSGNLVDLRSLNAWWGDDGNVDDKAVDFCPAVVT